MISKNPRGSELEMERPDTSTRARQQRSRIIYDIGGQSWAKIHDGHHRTL